MVQPSEEIRVLLVENDGGTIQAVKWALEEDERFDFLGYVSSKAQIVDFLDDYVPDVALVDIGLVHPGDGLTATKAEGCFDEGLAVIELVKQISSVTRVIGFSNHFLDNPPLVKEALCRGADALIAKQDGPADWLGWSEWLRYHIRAVIGGWWRMSPAVARYIEEDERSRRTKNPDAPLPLTDRQLEVLHLFACGLNDKEIALRLNIVDGAVRGHISNIKARLHLRYRWELIDEARLRGLGGQDA